MGTRPSATMVLSGDRTPNMDVSQWQWTAPMYNGMKISNVVCVLEHKIFHR